MSIEIQVKTIYSDPIGGQVRLRQDGVMDAINNTNVIHIEESLADKYNPIIGYYGDTRRYSDGSPKRHTGFDYVAPVGTIVKAVHEGVCNWIRIGTPKEKMQEKCVLRKKIIQNKKNEFNVSACQECKSALKENCYGAQLWLQWKEGKTKKWAFYAHLSKFNDKIWNSIKDTIKQNIVDYNPSCSFNINDTIGFSGCTGNAYAMKNYQEHLHFECLDASLKKQNPNAIVKTKFYLNRAGLCELNRYIDEERSEIKELIRLYNNKCIDKDGLCLILNDFDSFKGYYIVNE